MKDEQNHEGWGHHPSSLSSIQKTARDRSRQELGQKEPETYLAITSKCGKDGSSSLFDIGKMKDE